jgi:hypothetical protein
MLQTIVTIIIVLAAAIIALIRLIRFFINPLKKCGGCSQNCGGCALEDLKREIEEKNHGIKAEAKN